MRSKCQHPRLTDAGGVVVAAEAGAPPYEVHDRVGRRGFRAGRAVALLPPQVQPDPAPHAAVCKRAAVLACRNGRGLGS